MQYTPRILIIHRALAPYRIDLFSHLAKRYDVELYLEYGQPLEQNFNLAQQGERIQFDYKLLAPGGVSYLICVPRFCVSCASRMT